MENSQFSFPSSPLPSSCPILSLPLLVNCPCFACIATFIRDYLGSEPCTRAWLATACSLSLIILLVALFPDHLPPTKSGSVLSIVSRRRLHTRTNKRGPRSQALLRARMAAPF